MTDAPAGRAVVVVPCHDEERRLRREHVAALVAAGLDVLLVDDGSTDGTAALLRSIADAHPSRAEVLALSPNRGKGEAVREGLRCALAGGAEAVAYADADFATPPEEVARLVARLRESGAVAVLGCRLARLGADVRRSTMRHYAGRVFATAASRALRAAVYDTQCGAKAFANAPEVAEALERPFSSRWAFDVELIGRIMNTRERAGHARTSGLVEMPLAAWHDAGGSKLGLLAMARAFLDVLRIGRRLRRERAAGGGDAA